MKNLFSIIIIILIPSFLYGEDSLFKISKESLSLIYYSESEFSKTDYYDSLVEFSQGLSIYSDTDDVTILFNNQKYKADTLVLNNLDPGLYQIIISKNGYDSIKKIIEIKEDYRAILKVTLGRQYGFLQVKTESDLNKLFLNNIEFTEDTPIPTGIYSLKIKGFGYKDVVKVVTILDQTTTFESIIQEVAEFKFESVKTNKKSFNPNANSDFKNIKFNIKVNAPNTGILEIVNSLNEVILTENINFTTWDYSYSFNGKLDKKTLDNGEYLFRITVNNLIESKSFNIDNDLIIGLTDQLFTPTAEINSIPLSITSFGLNSNLTTNSINIPFNYYFSFNNHIRINTGIDFEIFLDDSSSDVSLFGEAFLGSKIGMLIYGFNLKYNLNSITKSDKVNLYNSLNLNFPLTLKLNNFRVTATPEYQFNFSRTNNLFIDLGFIYDNQMNRIGISGKVDVLNLNDLDFNYGIEYHRLLPNSQTYLDLNICSNSELNFILGLGLSVIY